jgi:hypothetical protein
MAKYAQLRMQKDLDKHELLVKNMALRLAELQAEFHGYRQFANFPKKLAHKKSFERFTKPSLFAKTGRAKSLPDECFGK